MTAAHLLTQHRDAGTLVATGSFDLDPAQAREKLARYRLTQPYRYVLQFVQAAVLLKATYINVRVDADELDMRFDGEPLEARDLKDLYLHGFGGRGNRREEALRHLAMGVLAASSLDPAMIEIEGHGLRWISRGDKETLEQSEAVEKERTRIYVREKLRAAHLLEFFARFGQGFAEEHALVDAEFAEIPIHVNGRRISAGLRAPRKSLSFAKIATPTETGRIAIVRASARPGTITVVQNGVRLEDATLDLGDLPVEGVIESHRLAINLAQSGFVRNERWRELVDEVLLPTVFRLFDEQIERSLPSYAVLVARDLTGSALRLRARCVAAKRPIPDEVDPLLMRLGGAPLWRAIGHQDLLTTAQVLAQAPVGTLAVTRKAYAVEVPNGAGGGPILLIPHRGKEYGDPRELAEATARELVDVTEVLREQYRKGILSGTDERPRYSELTLHTPPRLNRTMFRRTEAVERAGLQVEVGWGEAILDRTTFFVAPAPEAVERVERGTSLLNKLTIVVASKVPDARKTPAELLRVAGPTIARAVVQHLRNANTGPALTSTDRELYVRFLEHATRGTLLDELSRELGALPDSMTRSSEIARAGDPEAPTAERLEQLGNAADLRLFETLQGSRLSLNDVARGTSTSGALHFVRETRRHRALQMGYEYRLTGFRGPVVWLDEGDQRIIAALFGASVLVDCEDILRADALRIERQTGGMEENAALHGPYEMRRRLSGDDLDGEMALAAQWYVGAPRIDVLVLHERRRLAERQLEFPFGRFRAVVTSPALNPTPDLGDVVEDDAYFSVCERLQRTALDMFEEWSVEAQQRADELSWDERLRLWEAVLDARRNGRSAPRLDWKVFPRAEGGDVSFLDLKSCALPLSFTTAELREPAVDSVALRVPLASPEHVRVLRELFGEVGPLESEAPGTATVIEAGHSVSVPTTEGLTRLHGPLAAFVGFASVALDLGIDDVEVVDDELRPRLEEHRLIVGRHHPITRNLLRAPDDPRHWGLAALALRQAAQPKVVRTIAERLRDQLAPMD